LIAVFADLGVSGFALTHKQVIVARHTIISAQETKLQKLLAAFAAG
jgi:DNA-binding LytR/AlgR family response regulator